MAFATEQKNQSEVTTQINDIMAQLTVKNASDIKYALSQLRRKYPGSVYDKLFAPAQTQVIAYVKQQSEKKASDIQEQKDTEQQDIWNDVKNGNVSQATYAQYVNSGALNGMPGYDPKMQYVEKQGLVAQPNMVKQGNTMVEQSLLDEDRRIMLAREENRKKDLAEKQAATAQPETKATSEAPVYKLELTPEMQKIQDYVNSVTVKMPELTPELVDQWKGKLDEINKPWEEQAAQKLNEAFSAMNPLGYGSGSQKDATTKLIQEQEANKQAQALALGQTDVAQKLSEYDKAMNMALALGEYKDNAAKITTDQERQDYWANITRKWQVEDVANTQAFQTKTLESQQGFAMSQQDKQDAQALKMLLAAADINLNAQQLQYKNQLNTLLKQRGWQVEDLITARAQELQDYNTKKSDTWEMINASKPAEVSPIQAILTPILSGIASGTGAGAGAALYSALTTKPAETTTTPGVTDFWSSTFANPSRAVNNAVTNVNATIPVTPMPVNSWDKIKGQWGF